MNRMLRLIFLPCLLCLFACTQQTQLELTFVPALGSESQVYLQPLQNSDEEVSVTLSCNEEGVFVGDLPASETGFYNLVVVKDNAQFISTVYLTGKNDLTMQVEISGLAMKINNTPENRALSALNEVISNNSYQLWTRQGLEESQLKDLLRSYSQVADSLIQTERVKTPVAEYMKVWAYTSAYNTFTTIPRAQNIPLSDLTFAIADVLEHPKTALDNDYTSLFFSAFPIIEASLPSQLSLPEKMTLLYEDYKNEALRKKLSGSLMNGFIAKYNYSDDFEGGLATVKQMVEKYGLSESYVNEYLKRGATIVGSPFPAEVVLEDAEGKEVAFSTFKGKYVYVDLWASWCVPCCREVPHLQKLEAEWQNEEVVFVSISTDTDKDAWKKRMKELHMHGNQLIDRDNTLCSSLNVRGIPFFLIYDKEGKLHTYGAMRPSNGELKPFLEALK